MTAEDNEWRVEIDTGSGTLRPPIASSVSFEPGINDIPRAQVPVPAGRRFAQSIGPGAPAELYYRGDKLPIDELVQIDRDSSDQTDTLVLEGGRDLTDYRESITVPEGRAADAVDSLLSSSTIKADTTPYAPSGTETTTPIDSEPVADLVSATELDAVDDSGQPVRSAFTNEVESFDLFAGRDGAANVISEGVASAGDAVEFESSAAVEKTFTVNYRIPTLRLAIRVRRRNNNNAGDFTVQIDGEQVGSFTDLGANTSYQWVELGTTADSSWQDPEIIPGDHRLRIENSDTKPDLLLDVVSLYDRRVEPALTFDNSISNGDRVDGPEEFPDAIDLPPDSPLSIPIERLRSFRPITQVTVGAGGGVTSASVSTDNGATFKQSGVTSGSTAFVTDSNAAEATAVLSRYGIGGADGGTGTPATGNQPLSVGTATIDITTVDRRVIQSQERRGELLTILQDLAATADGLFEIAIDANGDQVLRWDYPQENRQTRTTEKVGQVSATVANDDQAERVRVFGRSVDFQDTLNDFPSTATELSAGFVVPGSESVRLEETGRVLERNIDYRIDYHRQPSRLVPLAAGPTDVDTGSVVVSGRRKIQGEASLDGVTDPVTVEISGLSLQESFAAVQAAEIALDELSEPRREADLSLSEFDPRDTLLDPLTAPQIPFDPERVTGVSVSAGSVSVGLASRASAADIINSLRRRSEELSRAV